MSIFISILLLAAITYFILRNKDTKAVLPETLQGNYISILTTKIAFYQKLGKEKQTLFEQLVLEFLRYVKIEGVGTEISDVDRVLVASSAIIPIFGFPGWKYKNLTNVILYPDTFDQNYQFEGENRNIMGMVGSFLPRVPGQRSGHNKAILPKCIWLEIYRLWTRIPRLKASKKTISNVLV